MTFIGFQNDLRDLPFIVIDIGYSKDKASCGIVTSISEQPRELQFGEAIKAAGDAIMQQGSSILVMEAVLSTYHQPSGNPDIRGPFEKGRGWYYGPGVATLAAAIRFLTQLRKQCNTSDNIFLAEAFLSFKTGSSSHGKDALTIYRQFWKTPPESLEKETESAADFIKGVPSVRVFKTN